MEKHANDLCKNIIEDHWQSVGLSGRKHKNNNDKQNFKTKENYNNNDLNFEGNNNGMNYSQNMSHDISNQIKNNENILENRTEYLSCLHHAHKITQRSTVSALLDPLIKCNRTS